MSDITVTRTLLTGLYAEHVPEESWELFVGCLLCGQPDAVADVIKIADGPILSVCESCHFGFLRRRPVESWIDDFYAREWDRQGPPDEVRPNPRAYNACAQFLPEQAKVLDVGAGYGGMLLPFDEAGIRVFAIEPSEQRRTYLSKRLGIPVANDMPDYGPYDLITMHHSLEHRYNPREAIKQAYEALKPNGLLYIAVPDIWQEHPLQAAHYVPHLSLFGGESLVKVLGEEGFGDIVHCQEAYDLEVLARKISGNPCELNLIGSSFTEAIDRWTMLALGPGAGHRVSAWTTEMTAMNRYTSWVVSGDSISFVRQPQNLRALWMEAEETPGLPIRLIHDSGKTVWVK